MVNHLRSIAVRLLFISTLAFISVGCSNVNPPRDRNQGSNPVINNAINAIAAKPPASPKSVEATAVSNSNLTVADTYSSAINTASSATTISQSAQSPDDWNLVISRWQQAIELLKTVPVSSQYYEIAKTKIVEYRQQIIIAKEKAIALSTSPPAPAGENVTNTNSQIPAEYPQMFSAKIKRRIARTPVIDVTFNGKQTFEMIVDSGASSTVITPSMAKQMGLKPNDVVTADTASATRVKFRSGKISSITVNGAGINNVQVAIANSNLDTGLLGQDFFSNYDVWIKRDVVEFYGR